MTDTELWDLAKRAHPAPWSYSVDVSERGPAIGVIRDADGVVVFKKVTGDGRPDGRLIVELRNRIEP